MGIKLGLMDFHIFHSVHCKWFTNPYSTNKSTILLLCISHLFSSIFQLNCHHQGADTKLLQLTAI